MPVSELIAGLPCQTSSFVPVAWAIIEREDEARLRARSRSAEIRVLNRPMEGLIFRFCTIRQPNGHTERDSIGIRSFSTLMLPFPPPPVSADTATSKSARDLKTAKALGLNIPAIVLVRALLFAIGARAFGVKDDPNLVVDEVVRIIGEDSTSHLSSLATP